MSRYRVYESTSEHMLLDVQSDLLAGLNTRVVVPLIPLSDAPKPADRLNPIFAIGDQELVMMTQFLAAVPGNELKLEVKNLSEASNEINAALDMLFIGF